MSSILGTPYLGKQGGLKGFESATGRYNQTCDQENVYYRTFSHPSFIRACAFVIFLKVDSSPDATIPTITETQTSSVTPTNTASETPSASATLTATATETPSPTWIPEKKKKDKKDGGNGSSGGGNSGGNQCPAGFSGSPPFCVKDGNNYIMIQVLAIMIVDNV